jgi:hypothetical protein
MEIEIPGTLKGIVETLGIVILKMIDETLGTEIVILKIIGNVIQERVEIIVISGAIEEIPRVAETEIVISKIIGTIVTSKVIDEIPRTAETEIEISKIIETIVIQEIIRMIVMIVTDGIQKLSGTGTEIIIGIEIETSRTTAENHILQNMITETEAINSIETMTRIKLTVDFLPSI